MLSTRRISATLPGRLRGFTRSILPRVSARSIRLATGTRREERAFLRSQIFAGKLPVSLLLFSGACLALLGALFALRPTGSDSDLGRLLALASLLGLFAVLFWAVGFSCAASRRRSSRLREAAGLCRQCGYDVRGLAACPECGVNISDRAAGRTGQPLAKHHGIFTVLYASLCFGIFVAGVAAAGIPLLYSRETLVDSTLCQTSRPGERATNERLRVAWVSSGWSRALQVDSAFRTVSTWRVTIRPLGEPLVPGVAQDTPVVIVQNGSEGWRVEGGNQTGRGKNELAKAIARAGFGDEQGMALAECVLGSTSSVPVVHSHSPSGVERTLWKLDHGHSVTLAVVAVFASFFFCMVGLFRMHRA